MCGFCGFTGTHENAEHIARAMTSKITHRGPDSEGLFKGDNITLSFRRLAIIGLEDGGQPLYNEDKTLTLVFNGAVYNHQELRDGLIQKGHAFATRSDGESILHLYEEHGPALVNYLRGMFAFALYDTNNETLLCARDHFGVKPFYYTRCADGTLLFGSEIKSFLSHPGFTPVLNEEALAAYLSFQYSALPETFFKGVYALPPAHYLTLKNDELSISRYCTPVFTPCDMTLEKAVDMTESAVLDSVAKHKVSDVEIGAFLSSGVDSGFLAACSGVKKTLTVGFEYEKYNEIEYARALSDKIGAAHHSKIISNDEYWDELPRIQYYMDEPLADPAAVAFYFAAREAAKHVKTAFSGEGADEFFGGYNIYKEPLDLALIKKLPKALLKGLAFLAKKLPFNIKGKNFLIRAAKTLRERYIGNAFIFTKEERDAILLNPTDAPSPFELTRPYYEQVKHEDEITQMQYVDIHLWLVGDILMAADKMSMAHALEVRVPYMDKEVFRAASLTPTRWRVNKRNTKYAFRAAAARHIPKETATRRKLGFPVPIRVWLKEDKYSQRVEKYFTNETARRYFKTEALLELLKTHKAGKRDNSRKIWTVYMFLLWHEQFFGVDNDAV
jgi:asparagine synthase (glutamine-hydrolysing)